MLHINGKIIQMNNKNTVGKNHKNTIIVYEVLRGDIKNEPMFYYMHLPASCVVTVVVVADVNPVFMLVAVTLTVYRMPSSRLLIITEPAVVVFILVGILVQALLVSVTVYWFAGRLFVGRDKDRVTDVAAVTDGVTTVFRNPGGYRKAYIKIIF